MTSIALFIFIAAIIYVMIWSIRNDGVRSIREQTGFVRMRVPPEAKEADNGAPKPGIAGARAAAAKTDPAQRGMKQRPPGAGRRPPPRSPS